MPWTRRGQGLRTNDLKRWSSLDDEVKKSKNSQY